MWFLQLNAQQAFQDLGQSYKKACKMKTKREKKEKQERAEADWNKVKINFPTEVEVSSVYRWVQFMARMTWHNLLLDGMAVQT